MTDKDIAFARLWTAGKTYRQIAEELHIGEPTLQRMRRDLGLPVRNPGFCNKPKVPSIYAAVIPCLCCRENFHSEDRRSNRVCESCKNTRSWRGGQDASCMDMPWHRAARDGA